MNRLLCVILVAFVPCLAGPALAGDGKPSKSAFESDPDGWKDILPDKEFSKWTRVHLPPDTKPSERNPWSLAKEGGILVCDGIGIKEMLLFKEAQRDGVFHVEWRFKKSDKDGYNSGVYVRTHPRGAFWHQVQVAHQKKAPDVGDLFGETPVGGKVEKFLVPGTGTRHANPVGAWNTYEITCRGKTVTVWLNGFVVTTWKDCAVPEGHVGLQCEYFYIEFRNLKFKDLR